MINLLVGTPGFQDKFQSPPQLPKRFLLESGLLPNLQSAHRLDMEFGDITIQWDTSGQGHRLDKFCFWPFNRCTKASVLRLKSLCLMNPLLFWERPKLLRRISSP